MAKGMSFDEIDGKIVIDPDLDNLFNSNMKNIITSNFKGNYVLLNKQKTISDMKYQKPM